MADKKLSATVQIDGIDYDVHAKTAEKIAKSLNIVHADGTTETFDGSTERTITLPNTNNFVMRSEVGVAKGVATLNDSGKVPAEQLPSYIDDVLEYSSYADFPQSAQEKGKIYVDTATNKTYRWSGTTYIEIGGGTGNGDMLTSVYDTNGNGKVDTAENAEKLGGYAATDYAKVTAIPTVVNNLMSTSTTAALSAAQGNTLNTSKQDKLVSGTNIKTINGASILGSGDLTISGGGNATPINDAILVIQQNGTNVATFTANSASDVIANITVPTITDHLTSTSNTAALSANQGKILNDKIDSIKKIIISQSDPATGAVADVWFKY